MTRPSWRRVLTGTAQSWAVLVAFWYAPILAAMADAERDEPWQRLNPLPLLFLFAVLAATARWFPPREPGCGVEYLH